MQFIVLLLLKSKQSVALTDFLCMLVLYYKYLEQ